MAFRKNSFRHKVLQALLANPELAASDTNEDLYAAVGAKTASEQSAARGVKAGFNRGEYTEPPDPRAQSRAAADEKPPEPLSAEASVFKLSGKGDLRDKVVGYFQANPHKLKDRDNSELYAAVGADDPKTKSASTVVKSQLNKALRESNLGVVVIEDKRELEKFTASFEEMEVDLKSEGIVLNARQMRAAEIYYEGTTQIDAYMRVYKEADYEYADKKASEFFQKKGVRKYMIFLKHRDSSKAIKKRRKFRKSREERAAAADLSHFAEWDKDARRPRFKEIVPKSAFKGVRSFKIDTTEISTKESATVKQSVSFTLYDAEKIERKLEADYAKPFNDGTAYSLDVEIQEFWDRFQDQTREDRMTALDLANQLEARGQEVPPTLKAQADYELAVMLRDGDDAPDLDSNATPDMFDFDNLDASAARNKRLQEFKEHNAKQLEFVKDREKQLKDFKEKRGYDNTGPMSGELTTSDDELPEVKDDFFAGDFDDGDFEGFKE